ncbi:MAG: NusG domain II-containing protein [Coriobacteriia bacterium]|nr:NusG domain II-containing protein [Coriobacteriia bacterium]
MTKTDDAQASKKQEGRGQVVTSRRDFIVIGAILTTALVGSLGYKMVTKYAMNTAGDQGPYVVIQSDGQELYSDLLSKDTELPLKNQYGTNDVVINNGQVWVAHASCKNQICVHTGKISEIGDMIVCLPNKVLIQLVSDPSKAVPLS